MTRHGKAWQGMARHGKAWQGMARHGKACRGMAGDGRDGRGWQGDGRGMAGGWQGMINNWNNTKLECFALSCISFVGGLRRNNL